MAMVPPGFRFHPTEEELVGYYLARKVASLSIDLDIIQEVDLYRIEPWDLQERCGGWQQQEQDEEQTTREWYFFSYKDRKYPSGTRTNRATAAGFWKATGRDKPVLSPAAGAGVIGMRKTLVFYRGRAPNGRKTDWIIHEYRLQSNEHAPTQEEGWVVCRAFIKPIPNHHHHTSSSLSYANGYPSSTMMMTNYNYNSSSSSSYYYDDNAHAKIADSKQQQQLVHLFSDADQQQPAGAIDWNLWSSLMPTPAPSSGSSKRKDTI